MQVERELAQPHLVEAFAHHLQRRTFFRNEKHPLPRGHGVRQQVGDGLRLAGARRALQHKGGPCLRGRDGLKLGRVRGDREVGRQPVKVVAGLADQHPRGQ